MARHTSQFLDEAVTNRAQKDQQDQKYKQDQQTIQATPINNFENMNPAERMVFLCDKFGVDKFLDLMEDKIAGRFKQYLKDITNKLQLSLQPNYDNKKRKRNVDEDSWMQKSNGYWQFVSDFFMLSKIWILCADTLATVAELC